MKNSSSVSPPTVYLNKTDLIKRGWTHLKIDAWLIHSRECVNPHYRSGPKIKRYSEKDVIKVEQSTAFQEWYKDSLIKRANMSASQLSVAVTKRKDLYEYINNLTIKIPKYSKLDLFSMSVNAYNGNTIHGLKEKEHASLKSDRKFLNRITCNLLRHECHHYEPELDKMFGKVGASEGYLQLKERIMDSIFNLYPFLQDDLDDNFEDDDEI